MKKAIILFLVFFLHGCKLIETRPSIDGYIFSSTNNSPVRGALIGNVNYHDNSIVVETITDSTGFFSLPSIKKNVLFFSIINETRFQFEVFKNEYCVESINFNNTRQVQKEDRISIDTIYLKPCIDTLALYIIDKKME